MLILKWFHCASKVLFIETYSGSDLIWANPDRSIESLHAKGYLWEKTTRTASANFPSFKA